MRRIASLALLLLGGAALAHAQFATPVHPIGHVEPGSPLAKSMVDEMGAEEDTVVPHIVNGQPAGPGQFPYMVMTFTRSEAICSGSILAPGWVISAAHCFEFPPNADTGTATMGTNRLTIRSDPAKHEVYSYIPTINAAYNGVTLADDIAVAKLSAYSKYPPLRVQTAELAALSDPGKPVTEVGWGCTQPNGPASSYLRWAETTVEPASVCEAAFGILGQGGFYRAQTNVCLDGNPKSTCPGDSGGPAVATNPANGWPYNIGVVSYGNVPGVDPTVNTRLTAYWNWIRTTTGLSLQYYDVVVDRVGGFIRASDASPTTGSVDPGYVTPASAGSNKPPKMHVNKTVDSWSVSAPLPAGATVISQAYQFGLNIALYGVFPATYDRVLDLLNYKASQCKAAKDGRSIKCFDATTSVTLALRGSNGEAKLTVKANGRDIRLGEATGLKAYLWLVNGDNYLIYKTNNACKRPARKVGIQC